MKFTVRIALGESFEKNSAPNHNGSTGFQPAGDRTKGRCDHVPDNSGTDAEGLNVIKALFL